MNRRNVAKEISYIGVAATLAIVVGYVENLIPFSFAIPGIKLGLANMVVIFILYRKDAKSALIVSMIRIVILGFLFGNLSMMLYSMAGGIFSWTGMVFIKKIKQISIIGVSICGGVLHNIGQILLATIIVENLVIISYIPVLMVVGIVTGILIGSITSILLKRVP